MEPWHDFYLLIGGAAGALIGLLFVVASLTSGMGEASERGRRLYLSPVVGHFGVVLAIGGLGMAPHAPTAIAALIVAAVAGWGLGCMAFICRGFFTADASMVPHWSDPWWYGVGPTAVYAVMLGSAGMMLAWPEPGLDLLAATQGALVALSVRNAWDLITWIAPRAKA
jgi:hypothetical protein